MKLDLSINNCYECIWLVIYKQTLKWNCKLLPGIDFNELNVKVTENISMYNVQRCYKITNYKISKDTTTESKPVLTFDPSGQK